MKCSEVMILGEKCVLSLIYIYVAVCSVQYGVSLLFASICYFLISGLMFFNIPFVFDFLFCMFVLKFVYSVFLYCFVSYFSYSIWLFLSYFCTVY